MAKWEKVQLGSLSIIGEVSSLLGQDTERRYPHALWRTVRHEFPFWSSRLLPASTYCSAALANALEVGQSSSLWQGSTSQTPVPDFNAGRFMEQWISNPGPEVCGYWQTTYSNLHRDIRTGVLPRRYITFQDPGKAPGWMPRSGLGDYLIGMVSTFIAGLLTNRAFIMENSDLVDYIQATGIDWRMGDDVPLDTSQGKVAHAELYNGKKGTTWKDGVVFPVNILEHFGAMDKYENIVVGTNGGILTRIFQDPESATYQALHRQGLRLPTAFGCILRFIMRPKREVWELVLPQVKALRKPGRIAIGIHMRTSDTFAWEKSDKTVEKVLKQAESTVIGCAKKVTDYHSPQSHHPIWLFLSDSAALKKAARLKYPERIMGTPVNPSHPRFQGKKAIGSALAEWLLLTVNHFFVITESGYAKTAAAYNIERPPIFLFSHYVYAQAKGKCDPARPSSLMDFTRWSGL